MKTKALLLMASVGSLAGSLAAQPLLFDFDNAPLHSSLPLSLTLAGVTAQFSATGQGFSIQQANSLGFTPTGFSGYCIYPNSVFASDLQVSFSQALSGFSILYAPEEYACDSSAQLRVTAYVDSAFVGTSVMTADPPGTWPSATLSISAPQGFNSVVVHYDAAPPTGGDWGPIFMADNMSVTPVPEPSSLAGLGLGLGIFFGFRHGQRCRLIGGYGFPEASCGVAVPAGPRKGVAFERNR